MTSSVAPRVAPLPQPVPPAANRLDRERRGVVVHANAHPPFVPREIVDAIGNHLAQPRIREVVPADLDRLAPRSPRPPCLGEGAHQLLLLGIHRDHGLVASLRPLHRRVEVAELAVQILEAVPCLAA
jgi:hypothetical protein